MKFSTLGISRVVAIAVAVVGLGICSSAYAEVGHFMLDLEANGAIPGGAGGKSATITTAGEVVTMKVYALFQGSSGTVTNYTVRAVAAWFRSSNGGLLGNLSALNAGNYVTSPSQVGTRNDIDVDGDLDIGGSFGSTTQFSGFADNSTDYGFGTPLGARDGTITGATANALNSGVSAGSEGMAYSLVGYLTFTPITPTVGQVTTARAIPNFGLNNGVATGAESAQDLGVGTGGLQSQGRFGWNGNSGNNSQVLSGAGVVITVVPEPATLILAGLGAFGLGIVGLRRFRRS